MTSETEHDDHDGQELETAPVISCGVPLREEETFPEEKKMSLGDHILELRSRLIIAIVAFMLFFIPSLIFCYQLFDFMLLPLGWAGDEVEGLVKLRFDGPWKGLSIAVSISLYISIILSMPVWIYQMWLFISPGLNKKERRAAVPIFAFGSILFLTGVFVAFRFATPLGLNFLALFNSGFHNTENLWLPDQYFSFIASACIGFGLGFETPLVMMALARVGIITPELVMRYWRQVIMVIVVLGAILTPPDPLTQAILASIMTILFFIGYGLTVWVSAKKEED
ncbi:MAG: twin-arginine translocase subunit TatC [Planctomycetes bacterium]|nr:twin-arginine translocase subunit TatC [Planctomycetota bacterium]